MKRALVVLMALGLGVWQLAGCTDALRERHLQRVAKDWCMTVRASQVIPVYPLTEDLQPGDVFLVETPIQSQVDQYRDRGFLPLDYLVVRLGDLPYAEFYKQSPTQDSCPQVPHPRAAPVQGRPAPEKAGESLASTGAAVPPAERAPVGTSVALCTPLAGFPTYRVSVRSGMDLQLAIPIKGIPVALAFLQADRADASVTMSDAYTYGVPNPEIVRRLEAWATQSRPMLRDMVQSVNGKPIFLRAVSRVYLARQFAVSMMSAGSSGAGARVVLPPPAPSPSQANATPSAAPGNVAPTPSAGAGAASAPAPAGDYEALAAQLQRTLQAEQLGGTLRVLQASQRSVTLEQKFDRPLVVGYLGVDMQVLEGGYLGPPIITLEVLKGSDVRRTVTPRQMAASRYRDIKSIQDLARLRQIVEHVARRLPADRFGEIAEKARTVKNLQDVPGLLGDLFWSVDLYITERQGTKEVYDQVVRALDEALQMGT